MPDIGGGVIRDYSFTKAWGVNPSAASGVCLIDTFESPGSDFQFDVGDYVAYSFGSLVNFIGIMTEVSAPQSFGAGKEVSFQVVDNRIRLAYKWVFGAFNIEDDTARNYAPRPDAPEPGDSSFGSSEDGLSFGELGDVEPFGVGSATSPVNPWGQRRKYRHLLPQHWQSGIWTYTDEPLKTTQILNYCFNYSWGGFDFTRIYHPDLNQIVLTGLDYTGGIRLSNLISEINSKVGLEVGIFGANELRWVRKGEGVVPVKDIYSAPYSSGRSLTANDTGVRVVGGRTRLQKLNIALEPDWQPGWEQYIDEVKWRRSVAEALGMPVASKSDQLNLSAAARAITVYQFAKAKGDTSLLDSRRFGNSARNNLPAWVYIQELVYKSYRIPSDFTLYGLPLSSLEIADSLLCATDVAGDGLAARQVYADDPVQYYPASQASAIVRGQPLDLLNARDIRIFYRNSGADYRNQFTIAPDFEVDPVNKSIRFSAPIFVDGDPDEGKSIYLKWNKGEGGGEDVTDSVVENSDYLDVVVPNPDYQIQPAQIFASFCFLLSNFHKDYGSGPRLGAVSSQGIDLHVLDTTGSSVSDSGISNIVGSLLRLPDSQSGQFSEILYADGEGAYEKARDLANSSILRQAVEDSGGFTRNGFVGTELLPTVDRITVNVRFGQGITEEVSYVRSMASKAAFSERTLQRIQRSEELFSGQEMLKKEIREYRMLAALEKNGKAELESKRSRMRDVFSKPVGSEDPSVQSVRVPDTVIPPDGGWKPGHVIWLDDAGSVTMENPTTFGGVLVSGLKEGETTASEFQVALTGRVPVLVSSGVQGHSAIALNPGDQVASNSGELTIGRLAHGEEVPASSSGEVMAMVDLGSASKDPVVPLHIIPKRPRYIPGPAVPVPSGHKRFFIEWGTISERLATNWDSYFDVNATTYFFAKVYLPITGPLLLNYWEIVTGPEVTSHQTPQWEVGGDRPEYAVCLLGSVLFDESGNFLDIVHNGGGSMTLTEHISEIRAASNGSTQLRKQLYFSRQMY